MKLMKKCTALLMAVFMATAFVACSGDDDDASETPAETSTDISGLKVGQTITYNGKEYWVTKNTYESSASASANILASRSVARAAESAVEEKDETETQIAESEAYIKKYLDKEFHGEILRDYVGIATYIEIFEKGIKREKATSGDASFQDKYVILNNEGTELAKFSLKWQSNVLIPIIDKSKTDQTAQREAFNALTDDDLRAWDAHDVTVENVTTDVTKKKKYEIRYNYYNVTDESDPNYKKINLEDPKYTLQWYDYQQVATGSKFVYRKGTYSDRTNYRLLTNGKNSNSAFLDLIVYKDDAPKNAGKIIFTATGEGTPNGSTAKSDYQNKVQIQLFDSTGASISVTSTLGESETNQTKILSQPVNSAYVKDFSEKVKIYDRKKENDNWTDVANSEKKNIALSDIGNNCDFMSVSSGKTTVNGSEVPASMTYYAYFKDESGNRPVLDKYAAITCYPEYDTTSSRIVYKVTEQSIQDYIDAYKKDFAKLAEQAATE